MLEEAWTKMIANGYGRSKSVAIYDNSINFIINPKRFLQYKFSCNLNRLFRVKCVNAARCCIMHGAMYNGTNTADTFRCFVCYEKINRKRRTDRTSNPPMNNAPYYYFTWSPYVHVLCVCAVTGAML